MGSAPHLSLDRLLPASPILGQVLHRHQSSCRPHVLHQLPPRLPLIQLGSAAFGELVEGGSEGGVAVDVALHQDPICCGVDEEFLEPGVGAYVGLG